MKIIKKNILLLTLLSVLIFPAIVFIGNNPASAQADPDPTGTTNPLLHNISEVGKFAGFQEADETSAASIAGTVVNAALGLLGVIFIILTIYAGFMWMTAQGDETKVEKAKIIIRNCIIGLILITSAWAIYNIIRNSSLL